MVFDEIYRNDRYNYLDSRIKGIEPINKDKKKIKKYLKIHVGFVMDIRNILFNGFQVNLEWQKISLYIFICNLKIINNNIWVKQNRMEYFIIHE